MALQRMASGGAPPLAAYGAAWLLTLACVLVVQLARVSEFSAIPFVILLTLGVGASAWASRFPLSEGARLVCGFLDGALALICLTGQAFLNTLFGIEVDASIENYLSLSFLWYLCLHSALMVTMNALVFQSVPALALFGLIATYMLAAQILWLFVLMLLGVLFLMLASHRLEWGRARASLETGYALRTVLASGALAGLLAFLATPILALTIGRAISTVVVGMPLRGNFRTTPSETPQNCRRAQAQLASVRWRCCACASRATRSPTTCGWSRTISTPGAAGIAGACSTRRCCRWVRASSRRSASPTRPNSIKSRRP
jgi:hypothetical protein